MNTLPNDATNFEMVATMNNAFGNPQGDARDFLPMPDMPSETETHYSAVPWGRLDKQCRNIHHEYMELLAALHDRDLDNVRDALCDIMVFAYGAFHFLGIDADADMQTVLAAVMTRFIKDDNDKMATIRKHAEHGVTDVYFEGKYPFMVMKSASDQPDAPKGKFLKSASYCTPVFSKIAFPQEEIVLKIPGAFDPQPYFPSDCV